MLTLSFRHRSAFFPCFPTSKRRFFPVIPTPERFLFLSDVRIFLVLVIPTPERSEEGGICCPTTAPGAHFWPLLPEVGILLRALFALCVESLIYFTTTAGRLAPQLQTSAGAVKLLSKPPEVVPAVAAFWNVIPARLESAAIVAQDDAQFVVTTR